MEGANSRHRISFTLIEFLVVIAIIAVLAALLLPELNRARENGRTAVCISQQRQIIMALLLYAGDNNDFLPPYGTFSARPPPDSRWWYVLIRTYLGQPNDPPYISGTSVGRNYLGCPFEKDGAQLITYGVNYHFYTGVAPFAGEGNPPLSKGSIQVTRLASGAYLLGDAVVPVGTTVIYSPAAWTLTEDTDRDSVPDTNLGFIAANQYNNFRPRHTRGGVFTFADGSTRRVALLDWGLDKDKLWGP